MEIGPIIQKQFLRIDAEAPVSQHRQAEAKPRAGSFSLQERQVYRCFRKKRAAPLEDEPAGSQSAELPEESAAAGRV